MDDELKCFSNRILNWNDRTKSFPWALATTKLSRDFKQIITWQTINTMNINKATQSSHLNDCVQI